MARRVAWAKAPRARMAFFDSIFPVLSNYKGLSSPAIQPRRAPAPLQWGWESLGIGALSAINAVVAGSGAILVVRPQCVPRQSVKHETATASTGFHDVHGGHDCMAFAVDARVPGYGRRSVIHAGYDLRLSLRRPVRRHG